MDNHKVPLSPCPRCGGEVEYWTSRDINILNQSIFCEGCGLDTFCVDSVLFLDIGVLPNLDYETTVMKYNAWCKTKPNRYCEEYW